MQVVPVSRNTCRQFIREHHRHSIRPPSSEVLRAGLAQDGALVAVATAGMPARELMDGFTLEISRVCVRDGIDVRANASSRLYGALARSAKALGWRRLVTYTLEHEPGTSLRAAGFAAAAAVPARHRAQKVGARPRYQANLFGEQVEPEVAKTRWIREL